MILKHRKETRDAVFVLERKDFFFTFLLFAVRTEWKIIAEKS